MKQSEMIHQYNDVSRPKFNQELFIRYDDDIVNALTGQSSNLFAEQKERGIDLVMSRMTMILAIAFFVIAIILRMD